MRAVSLPLICAVIGAAIGAVTGLASGSLLLIGLWPLAAAFVGGWLAVSAAHLARVRHAGVHLAAAALLAISWAAVDRGVDASLFRLRQAEQVQSAGLLLADHAILHDDDDPAALVDASLLAETGAAGVLGAARVQLRAGVPVLRVLRQLRVIPAPPWAHVLWIALRAALVALVVARALEHLRREPVCTTCGAWLRRQPLGRLSEAEAAATAAAWRAGERRRPALGDGGVELLEDRCPNGHGALAGLSLRRARGRGLGRRVPGAIATLPPADPA